MHPNLGFPSEQCTQGGADHVTAKGILPCPGASLIGLHCRTLSLSRRSELANSIWGGLSMFYNEVPASPLRGISAPYRKFMAPLCDLVLTFKRFPRREDHLINRAISPCRVQAMRQEKRGIDFWKLSSVHSQTPSHISQVTKMVPSVRQVCWWYNQERKEVLEERESGRKNSPWAED